MQLSGFYLFMWVVTFTLFYHYIHYTELDKDYSEGAVIIVSAFFSFFWPIFALLIIFLVFKVFLEKITGS